MRVRVRHVTQKRVPVEGRQARPHGHRHRDSDSYGSYPTKEHRPVTEPTWSYPTKEHRPVTEPTASCPTEEHRPVTEPAGSYPTKEHRPDLNWLLETLKRMSPLKRNH